MRAKLGLGASVVMGLLALAAPVDAAVDGRIGGRVTDEVTGQPLAGFCVDILGAQLTVTTDADGRYRARVPPGTYFVAFYQCAEPRVYHSEKYDNVSLFEPGTPVVVEAGMITSGISAALKPYGAVGGVITDSASGHPLTDACVTVLAVPFTGFSTEATTGADGSYETEPIPAQDYSVDVQSCSSPASHVREWHPGVYDPTESSVVPAAPGVVTTVDFSLERAGFMAGRVNGPGGAALENLCVFASPPDAEFPLGSGVTDAAGRYALGGIPTGSYIVFFDARCSGLPYASEYYDDAPDRASATAVDVVSLETTRGINAKLRPNPCHPFPTC